MDASQKVSHVLNRLSFGARPGDRTKVAQLSVKKYIQAQLNPESLPEPANLANRLSQLETLNLSPRALFEQYNISPKLSSEAQKERRERQTQLYEEAVQARLLKALESPRQLQEVMVDFWFNHFNVFQGKGLVKLWIGAYEQSAIRPHVFGKFKDMLIATAKHPAMLFYLDNWRNTDPKSDRAKGPFKGLNENYARELLELHTLGINGGYSQADVESLTRILTGWSMVHPQQPIDADSGFVFVGNRHDPSDKTLLGQTITGNGLQEGEQALALLAQHPATARHISYKLAQYFVTDAPSEPLVSQLAEKFLATDGDIKAVLLTLFESDEFWSDSSYQSQFKTPYQYLISVSRAIDVTNPPKQRLRRLMGFLGQLGMPLYRCQQPNGYPQTETRWLSPDAMMRRVSHALALVTVEPENRPDPEVLMVTMGNQLSPKSRNIISKEPKNLQAALMVGSPDMMYR